MLIQFEQDNARDLAIYGGGNYLEIVVERARDYGEIFFGIVFMFPSILAMFLLGLYAGKRGILHDMAQHQTLLRRVRFWGLLLGLLLNAAIVFAISQLSVFSGLLAEVFFLSIAGPTLSMGYADSIALLTLHERWRTWLNPLGFAGRMALTNYLTQSLICTTIFYGYGFGLFG